jgi:hypothetical protein
MIRKLPHILAIVGFALAATDGVDATVTIESGFSGTAAEVFSSAQFSYAAGVSASDLLHGLTPTLTGWNYTNNASPLELTDGTHGLGYNVIATDKVQGAWSTVGATATYNLGGGAGGLGFDITSVQSIADWVNVGFGNQAWRIEVKPVGGTYTTLATVNYQPLGKVAPNDTGTTRVALSNLDATGIESIRITASQVNGGTNSGAFVWRELDVFGAATIAGTDDSPPLISSLAPTNGATGVPVGNQLMVTFNEPIFQGSGNITIRNLDTSAQTVITLPDARVSVMGAALTIDPGNNLATSTNHAVRISAGAITDRSGNPFAGIADDTTWNFRTGSAQLRIMCLGDSITAGYTDNPTWANHPFKFGYRSGLHSLLTNAGYNFLFVGGSTEPWTGISGDPTYGGTYKPAFDLRDFGQDGHRGYGGKTASYLNSNILNWLASDNPDIILLKIGTNSQDQGGLNTLVNTITTTKPAAHLIIAQIMPKYSYQQGIVDYNNYIRNTLVPDYQAQGRKVSLVDQYAPFLTNPAVPTAIDQALFSNGINHPANPGYDKMAQVWFAGIEALGIGPVTFSRWISDPAFGLAAGEQGLHQDPDGDGFDNGVENFFGTHPGRFSQGLVSGAVNTGAGTFSFTHPVNETSASDLTATYRWSKDLSTFTADGNSFAQTTVTFTPGAPSGGSVTVTATINGTPVDKLFVDVKVTQD